MSLIDNKIVNEGLTFDDVLLVPKYSDITSRSQTDLTTKLSQNISLENPLSLSNSKLLYSSETYEKILSPALKSEKEEEGVQTGEYVWGPVNTTLFMNDTLATVLGTNDNLKIVFELWRFNSLIDDFQYSGIVTFLELNYN